MRITVELSLYPLATDFVGPITDFIVELRKSPGLEIVTNQMSTQVRGEFDAVLDAVGRCTRVAMERVHPVVLVAKFLNADLPIATTPSVGAPTGATATPAPVGAPSGATATPAPVGAPSGATGATASRERLADSILPGGGRPGRA